MNSVLNSYAKHLRAVKLQGHIKLDTLMDDEFEAAKKAVAEAHAFLRDGRGTKGQQIAMLNKVNAMEAALGTGSRKAVKALIRR